MEITTPERFLRGSIGVGRASDLTILGTSAFAILPATDRRAVLDVLRAAIVLDGRVTRHDRALCRTAAAVAGVQPDLAPLYQLRAQFLRGTLDCQSGTSGLKLSIPDH